MDTNENIAELEYRIEKRRYMIEGLKSAKDEIDEQLEREASLLMDDRVGLIDTYAGNDEDSRKILDIDPESPIDLVKSVRAITGRDPLVSVIKELIIDSEYDRSDLLELQRRDDVEIIEVSPNKSLKVETIYIDDK